MDTTFANSSACFSSGACAVLGGFMPGKEQCGNAGTRVLPSFHGLERR